MASDSNSCHLCFESDALTTKPVSQNSFYDRAFYHPIYSSPEPKAQGELTVWDSSRRLCVRPCVRPFALSNMNISETSWPIVIKFHQEHHLVGD